MLCMIPKKERGRGRSRKTKQKNSFYSFVKCESSSFKQEASR